MSGVTFQLLLAGGPHVPDIQFTDSKSTVPPTTFSSATFNFGTPDSSRIIVVTPNNSAITAVTIGGVAATKIQNNLWAAPVPSGSSGTVALTGGAATFLAVYAVYGMNPTPFASGVVSGGPNTININVPANGVAICFHSSNNTVSFTSGVTTDATNNNTGAFSQAGHAGVFSSAQTPLAITGAGGGGAFPFYAAVSYGP